MTSPKFPTIMIALTSRPTAYLQAERYSKMIIVVIEVDGFIMEHPQLTEVCRGQVLIIFMILPLPTQALDLKLRHFLLDRIVPQV